MKLTKYFMPLAAVALLASCSNDKLDGPGNVEEQAKGDLFFSMTFSPVGVGTRTSTDDGTENTNTYYPGKEDGTSDESNITSALIIFATKDASTYDYSVLSSVYAGGTSNTKITKSGDTYTANFAMTRKDLLDEIDPNWDVTFDGDKEKEFFIFVVANAPAKYIDANEYTGYVQKQFELLDDTDTYWQPNNFLMSNSKLVPLTIKASDIALGTHITASDPFNLGTVEVQRAMSRFDVATAEANTIFQATEQDGSLKKVKLTFQDLTMINMAQTANMFKLVGLESNNFDNTSINFTSENNNNWVVTPNQSAWNQYLFDENDEQLEIDDFFATKSLYKGYSSFVDLTTADSPTYTEPTDPKTPNPLPNYFVWRYAMENSNPYDVDGQKNGNSTGVIFRAQIDATLADGTTELGTVGEEYGAIYAYNNVIFGNLDALKEYVEGDEPTFDPEPGNLGEMNIWRVVGEKYRKAMIEANDGEEDSEKWKELKNDALTTFNEYLVKSEGFTIYRPDEDGKYFCYYVYWNRHNDNYKNTVQGIMEFANVRNNVYKLAVTSVIKLGHPSSPDDDPDPFHPGDEDEKDSFYCTVDCKVLPWEVRVNNIEF